MNMFRAVILVTVMSLLGAPVLAEEKGSNSASEKETKCPMLVPVTVELHPEFKEEDRIEAIKKYDAAHRLTNYLTCDMQDHKYKVAKPFKLNVLISDFRLRSGGSAFWLGAMAGADRFAVHVKVVPDSGSGLEFKEGSGTVQGGFKKPDPRQRINHMSKDLARKIMKEIEAKGYLAP